MDEASPRTGLLEGSEIQIRTPLDRLNREESVLIYVGRLLPKIWVDLCQTPMSIYPIRMTLVIVTRKSQLLPQGDQRGLRYRFGLLSLV